MATQPKKISYLEDIPALFEAVFGPADKQRKLKKVKQTAVQSVTIPEDLCTSEVNSRFSQLVKEMQSCTETKTTITALDYLIDTPLRDHHRFRPYLQKYASELLSGCAQVLENFILTDYPKILLLENAQSNKNKSSDDESCKKFTELFELSQRLLQSVAIVAMNLIIFGDINRHISLSSYVTFYNALLLFSIESTKNSVTKSLEKFNYTLLYLISDDDSLWIENDCHRNLSSTQIEAIFATLLQLLTESSGANQLNAQQWKKIKLIFDDLELHQRRIFECIDVGAFFKQANSILKAFSGSALAAEHNFCLLEIFSEGIFLIVKRLEKEKVDAYQNLSSFLKTNFVDSEPIVPFVRKVLEKSELVFQDENRKKRDKVKACPEEIDFDTFGLFGEKDSGLLEEKNYLKKTTSTDEKKDTLITGTKCYDHKTEEVKKDEPLPKPIIIIVPVNSTKPADQFLEQIAALTSTNNIDHSHAITAYLNRNLDDLIRLHPGAFEPHLNDLVNVLSRLYNQIRLFEAWGPEIRYYYHSLTALLKRIFGYSHLLRKLDFENTYPLLCLTVSVVRNFHNCDYGFHAIKDTNFETHHSIGMSNRILLTVRVLTFIQKSGNLMYYYDVDHFFTKGARRLIPGISAASLQDRVDEILVAISQFLESFEEKLWNGYADSTRLRERLEQPFYASPSIHPLDLVKKFLFLIVKSQGESIWADYHKAVPGDKERAAPMANFIRLTLNATFQGQEFCTKKDGLRKLSDWPPSYYGKTSSTIPEADVSQNYWNFSTKNYPDNSAKIENLTKKILPKFNSAYDDHRWIADTFKDLRKHIFIYSKNPLQFGGKVISKLFESSLRLLQNYIKQLDSSSSELQSSNTDKLKEAIFAIVGLLESLLNIEVKETDTSSYPFPKYQLQVDLDGYADLLEAVISVRYHYGIYAEAHQLLLLNWLLKYKPNFAVIVAAAIRVFNRAAVTKITESNEKKKQLYVLLTLAKFIGEFKIKNSFRTSRDERLEVIAKQVQTSTTLEIILEEAGQLLDRFKGSILESEQLYGTWQVVDDFLTALVAVKTDMMRTALEKAKKTKKASGQKLMELLERRLCLLNSEKNAIVN